MLILSFLVVFLYLNDYYKSDNINDYLKNDDIVRVNKIDSGYFFDSKNDDCPLIEVEPQESEDKE